MNINYKPDIIKKIGKFNLGIIEIKSITIIPSSKELLDLIDLKSRDLRNKYKLDGISKMDVIQSTRNAYKKLGSDPSRYRPSADSLIRRIVKGNNLYQINNVVDILNLISITSGYSIGGYDVNKINGPINIGIGLANEDYSGIGRGPLNIENLPVLRDSIGAFGTPTSDSERTMIDISSTEVLFIFYDFGNHSMLENILTESISLINRFCHFIEIKQFIIST